MRRNLVLSIIRLFVVYHITFYCNFANTWLKSIENAKNDVLIMAPGLYSSKLNRQFAKQSSIEFKVLINPEFLGNPEIIIGTLPSNVSVRVVDTNGLIPHCIALIDSKLLLFGGDAINDEQNLNFEPMSSLEPQIIENFQQKFKVMWNQVDLNLSNQLVAQHRTTLQESTIVVTSAELSENEIKYVASKNSQIFHEEGSPILNRIKPENRVYFESWSDAIASGRKPSRRLDKAYESK